MIKRMTTPRRKVGPTRAERERTLATSQTPRTRRGPPAARWSTKDIVEMIVARAQRDFPTEYEQSIKPWKDDFERTKQELACCSRIRDLARLRTERDDLGRRCTLAAQQGSNGTWAVDAIARDVYGIALRAGTEEVAALKRSGGPSVFC